MNMIDVWIRCRNSHSALLRSTSTRIARSEMQPLQPCFGRPCVGYLQCEVRCRKAEGNLSAADLTEIYAMDQWQCGARSTPEAWACHRKVQSPGCVRSPHGFSPAGHHVMKHGKYVQTPVSMLMHQNAF